MIFVIDRYILAKIMELPRETVISDLREVLHDSIRRYEYFDSLMEMDELEAEELFFPVHAVFLLGELKADLRDVLPVIDKLYEAGYVDARVCGTQEEVHQDFGKKDPSFWKREILSIYEVYDDALHYFDSYDEEYQDDGETRNPLELRMSNSDQSPLNPHSRFSWLKRFLFKPASDRVT